LAEKESDVTRGVLVGVVATVVVGLLIGIPTGIVETTWYTRMTPVLWWNYPVWALSSLLSGALAASHVRDASMPAPAIEGGKTFVGTVLSLFAVGCPICNKLVVLALGASGAVTWFAPIQPLLAVASIGLLACALWARRRAAVACLLRAPNAGAERTTRCT
jgi:hypothetical protein